MPFPPYRETHALLFPPLPTKGKPATLRQRARSVGTAFLDLIAPPHCVSCQTPLPPSCNPVLCEKCVERIRWITSDHCQRCGDGTGKGSGVRDDCPSCRTHPPVFMRGICSVAQYQEGPTRDIVLALKFGGQTHLAAVIGQLMAQRLTMTQMLDPEMIFIPVPPAKKSWNSHSMHHTTELAHVLAAQLKFPLVTNLLKKIRSTRPQATLTNEQRRQNLKEAFACAPRIVKKYSGRPVLLIDDVITTCSTVSECARALRAAGMGEVRAVSLAR